MTFALSGAAFAGTLTAGSASDGITGKQALSIALKDAGLAKSDVCKIEVEQAKGIIEVEFTKKGARTEYEYDIAKADGKLLEKSVEYAYEHNSSKSKIGKKAALKKVAKHSGIKLSTVKKGTCTYKYCKHEGKYKVKFKYGNWKYEYELLAPTGKVLEWEKERVSK